MRWTVIFTLLFGFHSIAQEWQLITPINSGRIVRDCSFIDEQHGMAIIQSPATVLVTDDGGISWDRPFFPINGAQLYAIAQLNSDTAMACGADGDMFRTVNGQDWVGVDLPTDEYLYGMDFVDETTGIAVGFNGVIIRTEDAGATWTLITSPTAERLMDVQMLDAQLGFAVGWNGTILRTEDGGLTWMDVNSGHDGALFSISFQDAMTGLACGWSQSILRTTDGGDTWTEVFTNGNNTLFHVDFVNAGEAIALGDWGGSYRSADGGATWVGDPMPESQAIYCGQYLGPDRSYLMGQGIMWLSTDEQASWERLQNGVPQAKYNGAWFLDDERGWAVGNVGILGQGASQAGIIYTENGGQTWDIQAQAFSGGWWDVHFNDEDHGLVIGGASVRSTSDGGENWSTWSTGFDITGVATWSLGPDEGVIGGDGLFSSICQTDNGGGAWNCNEMVAAGDFHFVDDMVGYAVRDGGTENIYKTTDGGQTWEFLPSGNFQSHLSLYFLDEQIGWVGTGGGAVLRTLDGGLNWESSFAGNSIIGIRFYSEQLGFCVDQQANVYRSNDGGATWEPILFGDGVLMPLAWEGHFTDNFLYLTCQSGVVFKTELGCGPVVPAGVEQPDLWCADVTVELGIDSDFESYNYAWHLPDGWTSETTADGIEVTPDSSAGDITLVSINNCGLRDSVSVNVQLTPMPETVGAVQFDDLLCQATEFTVEVVSPQIGVNYFWQVPDGWSLESVGSTAIINPSESAGIISVIAENQCGQSEAFEQSINLESLPEVSLSFDADTLCLGFVHSPMVSPVGGVFEGLAVDEGEIQAFFLNPSTPYLYTYSYTDDNGCMASAEYTLYFDDCTGLSEGKSALLPPYPNPVSDAIRLDNRMEGRSYRYHIRDMKGAVQEQGRSECLEIQVTDLAYGQYVLIIEWDGGSTLRWPFVKD
jgi:photosystem II stability/assembly factor-like uncharacterized protein